jgi:hypothetical protein
MRSPQQQSASHRKHRSERGPEEFPFYGNLKLHGASQWIKLAKEYQNASETTAANAANAETSLQVSFLLA